ncbi:MAG: ABC transporter ATP-binding protein [Cyclobacteriaceae bacterium]|nr:ABC transporter ATP-binding protein [Cyclobacteriaceae bacterium]
MMKKVIQVSELSKRYRLGLKEKQSDTLVGQISQILLSPYDNLKRLRKLNRFGQEDESVFWALKDVSFEVKEGEVLGIIGKNGAGKSTLLKILSQITEPTSGKIEIYGRVASLLEVGTGFHPELSGRENIYMNGTILGMTRREIDSKLEEIIEFSGVEKFIDTPVKFYSSGMKVRLGFSVAAHLDPEILIVDEVLAVGDFDFQTKCLGKMEDVAGQGRTVLFVSHNLSAVKNLCTKSIILKDGILEFNGTTDKAIFNYLNSSSLLLKSEWKSSNSYNNLDAPYLEIVAINIKILGEQPELKLLVETSLKSNNSHEPAFIAYDLFSEMDDPIFQAIPSDIPFIFYSENVQSISSEIFLPALIPGIYKLSVWIGNHYTKTFDWKKKILTFEVETSPMEGRVFPFSTNYGYICPKTNLI